MSNNLISREDKERLHKEAEKSKMDRYNLTTFRKAVKAVECPRCEKGHNVVRVKTKFRCTECRITFQVYMTTTIEQEYLLGLYEGV